jgi:K+-transporting ATPase ATPase C chain
MKTQVLTAVKFLLAMTILTGLIYPLLMTGLAQLSFPSKSNGSMIIIDGKIIGSELIGQKFDSTIYFWSRPSASGYNTVPSGASNLGPASDTLKKLIAARRELFSEANFMNDKMMVPGEMIFASGSGLDPHISPEAALLQVNRISKARNLNENMKKILTQKIKDLTEGPQFLVLGEKRINVLRLNIELDKITKNTDSKN